MAHVVVNAITVPAGQEEELERRFAARAGVVSASPGFEAFELLRPDQGDRYLVYTRWASREAYDDWRASASFASGHGAHTPPVASGNEVWHFDVAQAEGA